jgi:hypothetical protein
MRGGSAEEFPWYPALHHGLSGKSACDPNYTAREASVSFQTNHDVEGKESDIRPALKSATSSEGQSVDHISAQAYGRNTQNHILHPAHQSYTGHLRHQSPIPCSFRPANNCHILYQCLYRGNIFQKNLPGSFFFGLSLSPSYDQLPTAIFISVQCM